jgi:hypothetical protein
LSSRFALALISAKKQTVRKEAEKLGRYLAKPFSGRDLLDAVTQALSCQ